MATVGVKVLMCYVIAVIVIATLLFSAEALSLYR